MEKFAESVKNAHRLREESGAATGAIVHAFTSGTVVRIFQLEPQGVAAQIWWLSPFDIIRIWIERAFRPSPSGQRETRVVSARRRRELMSGSARSARRSLRHTPR